MSHDDAAPSPAPAPSPLTRSKAVRLGAMAVALLYLVGISAYLLTHGGWPTPDYLIPPLLLAAIALGRGWSFLFDWAPFLVLVLSWQATAGIANTLGSPVHVLGPAEADLWLFGGRLPTFELQQRFYVPGRVSWYDWLATLQHSAHFVLPVAVGLLLWLRGRAVYWRFVAAILVLFYAGFAVYALYPAAPPWLAASGDLLPPVDRIAVETVAQLPTTAPVGLAYTHFSANEVAAMPSLHAALPLLLALVLIRLFGWRLLPALLYPAIMGFNLVYLGEHYAVDVLAGYALALLAFAATWVVPELVPAHRLAWPRLAWPRVPVAVRRAGDLALVPVALASIAVIALTLRPGRPADVPGPVIPGLQVHAGQPELLTPIPCDLAHQALPTALDAQLGAVAPRYAAYLFDVEDESCASLVAAPAYAPPDTSRLPALIRRAPTSLVPRPRQTGASEYYALRVGLPADELTEAGVPAEHRLLLAVALGDVADVGAAGTVVEELAARALRAEP